VWEIPKSKLQKSKKPKGSSLKLIWRCHNPCSCQEGCELFAGGCAGWMTGANVRLNSKAPGDWRTQNYSRGEKIKKGDHCWSPAEMEND
jgi:hypothetical protein